MGGVRPEPAPPGQPIGPRAGLPAQHGPDCGPGGGIPCPRGRNVPDGDAIPDGAAARPGPTGATATAGRSGVFHRLTAEELADYQAQMAAVKDKAGRPPSDPPDPAPRVRAGAPGSVGPARQERPREVSSFDLALEELDVAGAGLGSVAAGELEHLLGHVDPVGLARGADPLGRQQDVDAAARAQVQDRLALMEPGHGGRVAAAQAGQHGGVGELVAVQGGVELGPEAEFLGRGHGATAALPAAAVGRLPAPAVTAVTLVADGGHTDGVNAGAIRRRRAGRGRPSGRESSRRRNGYRAARQGDSAHQAGSALGATGLRSP
jgi:hypothetical protein